MRRPSPNSSARVALFATLTLEFGTPVTASGTGGPLVGMLSDHLWQGTRPTKAAIDHATGFCLRAAAG